MQDVKSLIQKNIKALLAEQQILDVEPEVENPKDNSHGDFSSNIAMKLAATLKKNPFEIAQQLATELTKKLQASEAENNELEVIEKVEAVKPGFINFYLKNDQIKDILNQVNENFGKSTLGGNKEVMIEFGQPNTHKAFHVGHLKSAISGLSLVKLHENLGYKVIKANYFGDIGMHVAKTTWGFMHREVPEGFESWNSQQKMKYIDECYVFGSTEFKDNPESQKEIKEVNNQIYAGIDNEVSKTYKKLRLLSLEHQKEIWQSLGIVFDREFPESEVYEKAQQIVKANIGKIFEESEGAIIYRGEKVGLTNWVFLTSEGNPTYSAKDLALAEKKFEEYPNLEKAIVTTSIEQKDYFKVVIKVLSLINPKTVNKYFHVPFGWMLRGGKKFSSRMGDTVKGIDVLNEVKAVALVKVSEISDYPEAQKQEISLAVANAGLKFLILSHEFYKDFSYDPEKFLSFQGYSGPYLLYSYARAKSILAKHNGTLEIQDMNSVLNDEKELSLLKKIAQYPEIAQKAGVEITPHTICNYLYELAQEFNQFYTTLQVLKADNEQDKIARLNLTHATAQVLKNGLNLLGIETIEQM